MRNTVIQASKEQVDQIFDKHLKPFIKLKGWFFNKKPITVSRVVKSSFSYDAEDCIGFVTLHTITGKQVSYQLRGGEPMFIEVSGFDGIRYDICYPEQLNKDLYDLLKDYGKKAQGNFWKGGEI